MGGKQPAMNYILACLDAGKNVVTANKDLVASEGKKILATAKRNGKDFLYEASVAGGIPIIRPVKQCLAANHITELMGIFNGTTNFILTKMSQEGMEFGDALRLAQDMGYAEADPTADVEGLDAGRKVAILASAAFNSRVTFEDVYTEGITKITATDIEYAKEMGCTIKLLGVAKDTPEGIEARVHPMLIDSNHPLATVNDSYNAVFLTGRCRTGYDVLRTRCRRASDCECRCGRYFRCCAQYFMELLRQNRLHMLPGMPDQACRRN